jgi:hypothetical protein
MWKERHVLLNYLEYTKRSTSKLHIIPRSLRTMQSIVFTMQDELNKNVERRCRLQAVPLFSICIRNGHVWSECE